MTKQTKLSLLWASAALAVMVSGGALADDNLTSSSAYATDTLTFERWCSEIQHFDASRCAARHSADVANYQIEVSKLEAVEIQYERDQRQEREFYQSFGLYQTPDIGDPLK